MGDWHSSNLSLDCVATLAGHESWIYGVSITPDNKRLASVSFNKIFIWEIKSGQLVNVLESHSKIILSLSLSPDGQFLASGSADKTVKLWNLQTGELIETLEARKDPIHSVAFSSDGKFIAAGGENKYTSSTGKATTIYLWDTDSRKLVRAFVGHTLRIHSIAFNPDNSILASASNDNTIKLWSVLTGKMLGTLMEQPSQVSCISITPDGKKLISGGVGITVWDLETREVSYSIGGSDYVRCFAISPDGQYIAITYDDSIKIFNLSSQKLIYTADHKWVTAISFSPDGKLLASGDATCFEPGSRDTGGLARVWEVPKLQAAELLQLRHIQRQLETKGYFNPENIQDARERTLASIVRRQGQAEFRKKLLEAYDNCCCITDCDVNIALEAAHIVSYQGSDTNHISNGLLLRADIHTLFDLHQISVNPDSKEVVISSNLFNTCYAHLAGRLLKHPQDEASQPSKEALKQHYEKFNKG